MVGSPYLGHLRSMMMHKYQVWTTIGSPEICWTEQLRFIAGCEMWQVPACACCSIVDSTVSCEWEWLHLRFGRENASVHQSEAWAAAAVCCCCPGWTDVDIPEIAGIRLTFCKRGLRLFTKGCLLCCCGKCMVCKAIEA